MNSCQSCRTLIKRELPFSLSLILPQVATPDSDKYSRNIYNWVRQYGKRLGAGVWCRQEDHEGHFLPFDHVHADRTDIIIGLNDGMINGRSVKNIHYGNAQPLAYSTGANAIEITDWFWQEYLKRGRCLMDADHSMSLTGDKDRFNQLTSNTRVCNWCGMHQHLFVEQVTVEKKTWKNVPFWMAGTV